MTFYFRW